jgi:hypothetical protein
MSHLPPLGVPQLDVRTDGAPPRIRPIGLLVLRALDGQLVPLNAEISVAYLGRSEDATIHDSFGTSGTLVASAPAFTMADWDRDGVREEQLLQLGDEEALRYFDASTEQLLWSTGPKVIRFDWIQDGAVVEDMPYWSFTNDDASGPWFGMFGLADGKVGLRHYNGTSTVESGVAVAAGDSCSMRLLLHADGSVQTGLWKNGSRVEIAGARSASLAPESEWGEGGGVQFRLNEFGDSVRGVQRFRHLGVYGGTATRRELMEVL